MKFLINQSGSVDDIRCTLSYGASIDTLWASLRNERKNQNRITVVKMLRSALKRSLKQSQTDSITNSSNN